MTPRGMTPVLQLTTRLFQERTTQEKREASVGPPQEKQRAAAAHLGVCRASPHSQEQPLSPDWQGEEGRGPRLSPPRQVPVPQEKGSKFFY